MYFICSFAQNIFTIAINIVLYYVEYLWPGDIMLRKLPNTRYTTTVREPSMILTKKTNKTFSVSVIPQSFVIFV